MKNLSQQNLFLYKHFHTNIEKIISEGHSKAGVATLIVQKAAADTTTVTWKSS